LEDLLLDPNNPRFITSLDISKKVPDDQIKGKQKGLLSRFDESGKSEFFSIKDLMDSFLKVGYVPIDKIVVNKLKNKKFVVLEGNRRISALKILRTKHDNGKIVLEDELLDDMEKISAMELQTQGLDEDEVNHRISVLLGIRHHGSLLEWDALPKAYSIFKTYKSITSQSEFEVIPNKFNDVAAVLGITKTDVKKGLISYVVFTQLKAVVDGVKDRHFSLIQAAVTNQKLVRNNFISLTDKTFELNDDSIHNLEAVCQFDVRDKLSTEQKILSDPKTVNVLGRLVEKTKTAEHEDTRALALKGLEEAMTGELNPETNNLAQSLQTALDTVIDRETRTKWLKQLKLLLESQKKLIIDDFRNEGNELLLLEKLNGSSLKQLKRILDIN